MEVERQGSVMTAIKRGRRERVTDLEAADVDEVEVLDLGLELVVELHVPATRQTRMLL